VILGTYFQLSFMDFVKNTGLIAWIGFLVNTVFFIFFYKGEIFPARKRLLENPDWVQKQLENIDPKGAIQDRRLFWVGLISIFYVVVVLVTHHITHLSVAICALTGALIALLAGGPKIFIIVGAMEHVGLLKVAATTVKELSGGNFFIALSIILWVSAFGSSIVDNVPFAATMAPILKHMSEAFGFSLLPLVWSTALGTDIGGNGTPIGASANVVAVATYERMTDKKIGWGYYCKACYPAMMLVVLLCNVLLYFLYL
jgi:Na+/H+ antiporter NhaD/arsenite permease-like protein